MAINQLEARVGSPVENVELKEAAREKFVRDLTFNPAERPLLLRASDSHESKIAWNTDVKTALTRAQNEGKPLVVVFQEDRCGWCKLFGGELNKPATSAIANDAIFLRVTPSSNADGKQLANLCKVEGYPSVSVLTVKDGQITPAAKLSGFIESEKFVQNMRKVFADIDKNQKYS